MKSIAIVHKKHAISIIPKMVNTDPLCYYLSDDYAHFIDLQAKLDNKIKIKNLSGLFEETFQEIKRPFLEVISKLNKKYNSIEWWGGQLASRNTAATSLLLNITYLFCVKKILSDSHKNIIFIVNSKALSQCISDVAIKAGYQVVKYTNKISKFSRIVRFFLYCTFQILYFFWQSFQSRRTAYKLLKPLPAKKTNAKKRILIRTWITKGAFDTFGKFKDRNFGSLPAWLRSRNYEVWTLPMFFNLSMTTKEVYASMKDLEQPFLIPDHYLKPSDYLRAIYNGYKMLKMRIDRVEIKKTDVTPLFNEALKEHGFDPYLRRLNLCYPMLKRLKEMRYEIDGFYYPFEGNAPEKQFILGCREFFPDSKIIGFQHTTYFPNQLAYHLYADEKYYHPLPDQIVCSGPIYTRLHREAGFPSEILADGPNLRFESVYMDKAGGGSISSNGRKNLLIPLTALPNLAFELFVKVKDALKDLSNYKLYIRNHPLLSKNNLTEFLEKIGMNDYEFADEGIIQDWLAKSHVVISSGLSITIVESVAMGIPIIRVVPDNTFFYDPFTWSDYPLKPVNTSSEIRQQLQLVDKILDNDKEAFLKTGKQVLVEYFTKPTEENLKVFL